MTTSPRPKLAGIWSEVFVGSRHSLTINSLMAAVAGDATEQAWFTDTFYPGPAAGAAFTTGGSFRVAEFTGLDPVGSSAVMGNWMINSLLDGSLPGQTDGRRSIFVIDETAKVDFGPFDIELLINIATEFGVDKTVRNDTGAAWLTFAMELGTKVNGRFVPSTPGDGLGFFESVNFPNRERNGAFASVSIEEDLLVFNGQLAEGATANFVAFIDSDAHGAHAIALRQYALIPEPSSLTLLVVCGTGLGWLARRGRKTGFRDTDLTVRDTATLTRSTSRDATPQPKSTPFASNRHRCSWNASPQACGLWGSEPGTEVRGRGGPHVRNAALHLLALADSWTHFAVYC